MEHRKPTRRELLSSGVPALAGAVLGGAATSAAETAPAAKDSDTGKAWPARRKKIERAWLDLLGDFPTEIPGP
jgi:hypothetical protein